MSYSAQYEIKSLLLIFFTISDQSDTSLHLSMLSSVCCLCCISDIALILVHFSEYEGNRVKNMNPRLRLRSIFFTRSSDYFLHILKSVFGYCAI